MNRLLTHPLMLLTPWLLLLLTMWVSNDRRNLTVEWHDYILLIGSLVVLAGLVSWFFLPKEHGNGQSMSWTQLLVQCLPLYCMGAISTGSLTMDSDDDITRIRIPIVYQQNADNETYSPADIDRLDHLRKPMSDWGDSSQYTTKSLIPGRFTDVLQANMRDERQREGRVTLVGRLSKPSPDRLAEANRILSSHGTFKPVTAVLFRYVMTCCAGDAQPMTIFLQLRHPDQYVHGQWVEVSGELIQTDNSLPVMLQVDELYPISEPPRAYLTVSPFGFNQGF